MTDVVVKSTQRIRVIKEDDSVRIVIKNIAGRGLPPGGTTGQVLVKSSNTDYDVEWADPT